jgi:hypothetical protein
MWGDIILWPIHKFGGRGTRNITDGGKHTRIARGTCSTTSRNDLNFCCCCCVGGLHNFWGRGKKKISLLAENTPGHQGEPAAPHLATNSNFAVVVVSVVLTTSGGTAGKTSLFVENTPGCQGEPAAPHLATNSNLAVVVVSWLSTAFA